MQLSIITALSRPKNLPQLTANLHDSFSEIVVKWHCLTAEPNVAGNIQKNQGLDAVKSGWVYFLDDDNLIHPKFESALLAARINFPRAAGYVFSQVDTHGKRLRTADRLNYVHGEIDLAQFVLDRAIVGPNRFPLGDNDSDWHLFEKAALPIGQDIVPVDVDATYYNFLRPKEVA